MLTAAEMKSSVVAVFKERKNMAASLEVCVPPRAWARAGRRGAGEGGSACGLPANLELHHMWCMRCRSMAVLRRTWRCVNAGGTFGGC